MENAVSLHAFRRLSRTSFSSVWCLWSWLEGFPLGSRVTKQWFAGLMGSWYGHPSAWVHRGDQGTARSRSPAGARTSQAPLRPTGPPGIWTATLPTPELETFALLSVASPQGQEHPLPPWKGPGPHSPALGRSPCSLQLGPDKSLQQPYPSFPLVFFLMFICFFIWLLQVDLRWGKPDT